MKLPLLQDSAFVHVLPSASLRRGTNFLLTTDQSVPFNMKLPPPQDIGFLSMFCSVLISEGDLILC